MRSTEIVIDTNVAIVANGKAEQAGPQCMLTCIQSLRETIDTHCLLLDDMNLIINEYRRHLHPSGQPGVGDYFFKWLFENQANPMHCRKVGLTPLEDREFEEFPNDTRLLSFDRSDRKFVAVALASQSNPKIVNASDTDWWHHRQVLKVHNVDIEFICPELMSVNGGAIMYHEGGSTA